MKGKEHLKNDIFLCVSVCVLYKVLPSLSSIMPTSRKRCARDEKQSPPRPPRTPPRTCDTSEAATPTKAPPSPEFALTSTVPRKVWEDMQACGASIRYIDGLVCVYCTAGDDAYICYRYWAEGLAAMLDPGLQATCLPQPPTVTVPPMHLQGAITFEANCIINAYRSLRASDFRAGHPTIVGAGGYFTLPARYSHAAIATHAVAQRIANPLLGAVIGAQYVTISALPPGTYITTVQQLWKGRIILIHVMKS